MSNPNLQKIIKLTQSQYNTLANGGTVGDYTGLNDNYLYLIQEDYEFPVTTTARKILMSTSTAGLVQWQSLTANDIPSLNASKINAGIFDTARIPSLAASKITSGTFDTARIPSLDASKITSGTFADARIASASTWNAKYTKPSGGIPASDLAESYLKLSGGTMTGNISYQGTKATSPIIKFKDNTSDAYGNGIAIGGGGIVIIGAGESSDLSYGLPGDENLHLAADTAIHFYSNAQSGLSSAKHMIFDNLGVLSGMTSITVTHPSGGGSEYKINSTNYSLSFMIGSGDINRGIFDHTNNGWMIYRDDTTNVYIGGAIYENGTALSSKYLGINAKAADADKLDGQDSTYYLNYNNLTNKPTIPTVSNATITIKQTGISDQTFTLNGSATTITLADNNTWRPLGTGANDACAGNDSRLSNARPASDVYAWAKADTKPSYSFNEIADRGEAWLGWGGRCLTGSVTPIGMALSDEHSGNKLAFINGACLTFEYSADAGATWTDYGYSASAKSQFCTKSLGVPIGRPDESTNVTTSSRTRITLTAQNGSTGYVYTDPRKMLINMSSAAGVQVLIEYRTGTNYLNNGPWVTFGTYAVGGWSGWNDIPLVLSTLGGGTTQTGNYWQLRLTFIITSVSSSYPKVASVTAVRIYGSNSWTTPSTLASSGHLYSFDMSKNAAFPAGVSATSFTENGTSLTDKYLGKTAKAADADKLDGQDSTYYLNYNNLNNKPSAVLYTSQTLTDVQKTQARTNIGAGTSSFTGYTSSNKLHTDYINNAAGWTSVTETTVTNWGFTKNAGTVTKVDNVSPSSGNVSLSAVRYVAQTLTDAQKTQARTNIGAGTSSFSGSYNDLTNKPTIPTVSNATITIKQTGISDQTFTLNGSAVTITLADTNTTYSAEKGISLSGTKFGHSNTAITAQTTQALYPIKIDAYGHITGYGTAVTSLPASDVYAWAKAATKPSYTLDEVSDGTTRKLANYLPLAGTTALAGNIIPSVNSTSTSTGVSLGSITNKFNMVNARALRAIGIPASDLSMVEITSDDDDGAIIRVYDGDETNVYYYLPLSGNGGTIATQSWVTDKGYTSNVGTVTSVRVQAGTGLSSSTSTEQTTSLNTTISIASGYKLPTTTEWNGKQNALSTQTAYSAKGSATKVPQITTNTLGQVTGITEVTITNTKTYKHDIILTNSASASSNPSYKICFTLYSNQSTALTITGAMQLLFNKPPAAASANKLAAWARTTTPVYVVVTEWSRAYFYPRTILTDSLTYSGNNLTKFTLRPMEGAMDFDGYNMRISLFTSDLEFTVSNLTISDTVVEC